MPRSSTELTDPESRIPITGDFAFDAKVALSRRAVRSMKALAHGIRMLVFTNGFGATDAPLVHWRCVRDRAAMLRLGASVPAPLTPRR